MYITLCATLYSNCATFEFSLAAASTVSTVATVNVLSSPGSAQSQLVQVGKRGRKCSGQAQLAAPRRILVWELRSVHIISMCRNRELMSEQSTQKETTRGSSQLNARIGWGFAELMHTSAWINGA